MYKLKLLTVRVRSKRLLVVFFVLLTVFLLLLEIFSVFADNTQQITDNSSRVNFIKSLGFTPNETLHEEKSIIIPENFTDVWLGYNKIQKQAGYDLSLYCGKSAKLYKYEIPDFKEGNEAFVNLIVLDGRVIGGDISSTQLNGFMLPLKEIGS